jgi:hypothetical protein
MRRAPGENAGVARPSAGVVTGPEMASRREVLMRDFLEDLQTMSWGDRILTLALVVGLFPFWFPLMVYSVVSFRWRLWWYLRGSTEQAWERCAALWAGCGMALGGEIGPALETPLEHSLAEHFARCHPDARAFLVERLHDPDPDLAAYAFKCLIRFEPLSLGDIPKTVLDRDEVIRAMRGGCFVDVLPVGRYMQEYFQTAQYHQNRNAQSE